MLAIADTSALRNMMDSGLSPAEAVAALSTMKPAARYEGRAYYAPRTIAAAIRKGLR